MQYTITLNNFKNSKNAISNFNIILENGIEIWNVELIKFKDEKLFLAHSYSYQAKKANENRKIKVGDWVSRKMTNFSPRIEEEIIKEVLLKEGYVQQQPQQQTYVQPENKEFGAIEVPENINIDEIKF